MDDSIADNLKQSESFGEKLPDEQPDHSWGLDKLGDFARLQHLKIAECERAGALILAPGMGVVVGL